MKREDVLTLKPVNSKVILRQDKITKSSSGIILMADNAEKEAFCTVIASDSDLVKKDDIVYADPYTGIKLLDEDDALYVLVDESDILAVKKTN